MIFGTIGAALATDGGVLLSSPERSFPLGLDVCAMLPSGYSGIPGGDDDGGPTLDGGEITVKPPAKGSGDGGHEDDCLRLCLGGAALTAGGFVSGAGLYYAGGSLVSLGTAGAVAVGAWGVLAAGSLALGLALLAYCMRRCGWGDLHEGMKGR